MKIFPQRKSSNRLTAEFYGTFREELMPVLHKIFYEIEREVTMPNSFYEAWIAMIQKPLKA